MHALTLQSTFSSAELNQKLSERVRDVSALLEYYQPPLGEFSKDMDGPTIKMDSDVHTLSGDEERIFLKRLSRDLNLNASQCCQFMLRCMSATVRHGSQVYSDNTLGHHVLDFYLNERQGTLGLILYIVRRHQSPEMKPLFDTLTDKNTLAFVRKVLTQFKLMVTRPLTTTVLRKPALVLRKMILEWQLMLNVVIHLLPLLQSMSIKERLSLIQTYMESVVRPLQKFGQSFPIGEYAGLFGAISLQAASIFGELLQQQYLLSKSIKPQSTDDGLLLVQLDALKTVGSQVDALQSDHMVGMIYLSLSAILAKLHDQLTEAHPLPNHLQELLEWIGRSSYGENIELFKAYAIRAFESSTIGNVLSSLDSNPFRDAWKDCSAFKASLARSLSLFASTFELRLIKEDVSFVDCMRLLLKDESGLIQELWSAPGRNSLKHIVEHTLDKFPCEVAPLVGLLSSIVQNESVAPVVWSFLEKLPLFVQNADSIDAECVARVDERTIEVINPFTIVWNIVAEPGIRGTYFVDHSGRQFVQWHFVYSFWDCMSSFLTSAQSIQAAAARSHLTGGLKSEMLSGVLAVCRFLSQAPLTNLLGDGQNHILENLVLVFDLLTRLLGRLCSFDIIATTEIVAILDALGQICSFVPDCWSPLKQVNLTFSSLKMNDSGYLSRIRNRIEAKSGCCKYQNESVFQFTRFRCDFIRICALCWSTFRTTIFGGRF